MKLTPKADQFATALWMRSMAMTKVHTSSKDLDAIIIDLLKMADPPYRSRIQA